MGTIQWFSSDFFTTVVAPFSRKFVIASSLFKFLFCFFAEPMSKHRAPDSFCNTFVTYAGSCVSQIIKCMLKLICFFNYKPSLQQPQKTVWKACFIKNVGCYWYLGKKHCLCKDNFYFVDVCWYRPSNHKINLCIYIFFIFRWLKTNEHRKSTKTVKHRTLYFWISAPYWHSQFFIFCLEFVKPKWCVVNGKILWYGK